MKLVWCKIAWPGCPLMWCFPSGRNQPASSLGLGNCALPVTGGATVQALGPASQPETSQTAAGMAKTRRLRALSLITTQAGIRRVHLPDTQRQLLPLGLPPAGADRIPMPEPPATHAPAREAAGRMPCSSSPPHLPAGRHRPRTGRRRQAPKRSPASVRAALQAAMGLYSLHGFELFWDPVLDTKALLGWSQDTAVLAFRGTASLTNACSDLQVSQVAVPTSPHMGF